MVRVPPRRDPVMMFYKLINSMEGIKKSQQECNYLFGVILLYIVFVTGLQERGNAVAV